MSRKRRRLALGICGALLIGALGFAGGRIAIGRSYREDVRQARDKMGRGDWRGARDHLAAALPTPRLWGVATSEGEYWLGFCEWKLNRRDQAEQLFERVAKGSAWEAPAAIHLAEFWTAEGSWRRAEDRLDEIIMQGGLDASASALARQALIPLLQRQGRVAEARRLIEEGLEAILASTAPAAPDPARPWASLGDPVAMLLQLWVLDRGATAPEEMRKDLDAAGARNPDDDRVWLGRARLAIRLGDWDDAERWLKRCRERGDDEGTRRAALDWALGARRPVAVRELVSAIPKTRLRLTLAEHYEVRAWYAREAGDPAREREALQALWEIDRGRTAALERLIEIAARQDRSRSDSALSTLRSAKAEMDRGWDRYRRDIYRIDSDRSPATMSALADDAEAAGKTFEAWCWRTLASRATGRPEDLKSEALLRLDQARRRAQALTDPQGQPPWAGIADPPNSPAGPETTAVSASDPSPSGLAFEDVGTGSGIHFRHDNGATSAWQTPETMSGGVGLLDYDGDGRLDIYCVQGGKFPPPPGSKNQDKLYRNLGGFVFEDVAERSGLAAMPGGYGHGVAVGDYDNDGHPDLFVTRWNAYALYRNQGDGRFEEVTERAGLGGARDWPTSAAFADLDNDGDLDLYVCHYLRFEAKICRDSATGRVIACAPLQFAALPDHAFRNDGGVFQDVTEAAGLKETAGRGLGVVAADFDGDQRIDLFVANDLSANLLFRNLGGFRFQEVGESWGCAANAEGGYRAGMGIACGDFNRDGWSDLAVTNFFGESTTMYRNLGDGVGFIDATSEVGLKQASRFVLGFGAVAGDYDHNGWLDLVAVNGHVSNLEPIEPYAMPMQLFAGQANGKLRETAARAGSAFTETRVGRGLAQGDLDQDGDLDLVVLAQNGPLALLRNQSRGGRSLTLRLRGSKSNRDAVGAKVTVRVGAEVWSAQRIGGGSYQSADGPWPHFGLGGAERAERAERADRVEIVWPSGMKDVYKDLKTDQAHSLSEGGSPTR